MHSKYSIILSLLIITGLALGGCSQSTPIPTKPTPTLVLAASQVPTVAPTAIVPIIIPEPTNLPQKFKSKDPTTYVAATTDSPMHIDPALVYDTYGGQIIQNTYDNLIFYNRQDPNSLVPMLATEVPSLENGGISADGKTYTFKIREGVRFHDGSQMTPIDVAYTFQRGLLQGGTASPQWLLTEPFFGVGIYDITDIITPTLAGPDIETLRDDPENLQKVDPAVLKETCELVMSKIVADPAANTVTMYLEQPWAPFIPTLANSWGAITSKDWVATRGGWDGDCATWQNYYGRTYDQVIASGLGNSENGTGPFKLDHWKPGAEIVLVANEDYWVKEPLWEGGPSGPPKLKKVILKFIDDFSTRFAMLKAGDADDISFGAEVQWPQMDTLVGIECQGTTEDCQEIAPHKPLEVIKGLQSNSRMDIFYNFDINAEGNPFIGSGQLDGNGIPLNFFSDPLVRKGFAYCFNYDTYLNDALHGEGVRSVNVMLPGMLGYDETTPFYTYDPAKCTQMLKKSRWTKNADGTWTPDPIGEVSLWETGFRFNIPYNTGLPVTREIARILQTGLGDINDKFVVETTGLDWPEYTKGDADHNIPISFNGWVEDIHDTHNWVVAYTTGILGERQRFPADINAQFQEIISRAVQESNPTRRAEIYKEFNRLYYVTASSIPLFVTTGQRYQQRWVEGWYYNPGYLVERYFYPLWKD